MIKKCPLPRSSSSCGTFNKRINFNIRKRRVINTAVHAMTTAAVHNELSNP